MDIETVVERFLDGDDAVNSTGNLVSKVYDGVRILQHYRTVEAVRSEHGYKFIRNYECWSAGNSHCPFFADIPWYEKLSLPITGMVGVLNLPLSAIAKATRVKPEMRMLPNLSWVEIDGRLYGYAWGLLVDYGRQAAYMYRVKQTPNYGRDFALDEPVFEFKYVERVPLTYTYDIVRRQYMMRRRWLSRILGLPDLRALTQVGRVNVEIGNGLPSINVVNNAIYIYASKSTVFRVEVFHDFFGRRGTVAKVVALDNWPILPLSSYIDYLNREDDEEYPLPSVAGVWLVGRDVTGQLWMTEFHSSYYKCSLWALDRLAMGIGPDDRIVDES
jgi:hypothetical protein